jgi:hypothetical protein
MARIERPICTSVGSTGLAAPHHDGMMADAARAYFRRCPNGFAGSIGSRSSAIGKLFGLACEMDGRSAILPVWHGVTRADVLKFSPPLADKLAANTENSTADRIALQILSVIRPDILGKTPYDDLKRIASGEATRELQEEIARIREKLKEFQCPVCGSDLVASNLVPTSPCNSRWGHGLLIKAGLNTTIPKRDSASPLSIDAEIESPIFNENSSYHTLAPSAVNA